MSGTDNGPFYGGPSQRSRLDNPEIKAVLEANRAKLSLMAKAGPIRDRPYTGGSAGAQSSATGGYQAGPTSSHNLLANPVYEEVLFCLF